LYVDGATYQVRRVLMIDAQRNRNRFDFISPVVNKPVDPQEFDFRPPAGTRVIKP
jgi:outer membrane lipoprotein carrier protein